MKRPCLIVYGGAFNPPTPAHEATIRALSERAGANGRLILLPSGAEFIKMWKPSESVLPDVARIDMLYDLIKRFGLKNATIDLSALKDNLCTFDALTALGREYPESDILFAMGADKLPELPRWARASELVALTEFLITQYEKQGREELFIDGLRGAVRVEYVRLPSGTETTHSSELRARMRRHDPSLASESAVGAYMSKYPECARLAACSPETRAGDPVYNAEAIINVMESVDADALVFPELAISGFTCMDMSRSPSFVKACMESALSVVEATSRTGQLVAFGCPAENAGALYDCAVCACGGRLLAVIPKSFTDGRIYKPARSARFDFIDFAGESVPFGTDILVKANGCAAVFGFEIGDDSQVPVSPGIRHCAAGANVIFNLSSGAETASDNDSDGADADTSLRGKCAYLRASAGAGESVADAVYSGRKTIAFNGKLLFSAARPIGGAGEPAVCATVDLSELRSVRQKLGSRFSECDNTAYRTVVCELRAYRLPPRVSRRPFMPAETPLKTVKYCFDTLELQAMALAERLRLSGIRKSVIGVSGGLDSTLALLVAVKAYKALGWPPESIITLSMPGFGTGGRTHDNAEKLCRAFGTDFREISIVQACLSHMQDIGHDPNVRDVAYENIQARERTQILMDIANMENALVVGTGDLSELALGWCTFNGDHMSNYCVNCGVPKTLVRDIVMSYAENAASGDLRETLLSVLGTAITPELVPDGETTEQRIGEYELHDFFLYYFASRFCSREKLRFMAAEAFGAYRIGEIDKTLGVFFSRFFASQFKRNCMPDGPKVGPVSLSPRGELMLPSEGAKNWFTLSREE